MSAHWFDDDIQPFSGWWRRCHQRPHSYGRNLVLIREVPDHLVLVLVVVGWVPLLVVRAWSLAELDVPGLGRDSLHHAFDVSGGVDVCRNPACQS